jgi:hypothetical protein
MSLRNFHVCLAITVSAAIQVEHVCFQKRKMMTQEAVTKRAEDTQSEDYVVSLLQTHVEVSKTKPVPGDQLMQAWIATKSSTQTNSSASAGRRRRRRRRKDDDDDDDDAQSEAANGNETGANATTHNPDAVKLAHTLDMLNKVMVRVDTLYSWSQDNADTEFYTEMDQFETSLQRLQRALEAPPTNSSCKQKESYLVGQWSGSEACGLSRLFELVQATHGTMNQIDKEMSSIEKAADKKRWFKWLPKSWSSPASGVNQDVWRLVQMANLRVDKDSVSCAPCAFDSVDQSMVDSNADVETHTVYLYSSATFRLTITLTIIIIVLACCGACGMVKLPKSDSTQKSLLFAWVMLLILSILTACQYPYREGTAYG